MGWQKEDIQARADRLGIDSGDSSHDLDHMKKIAEAVGMDSYNGTSNADTDELERRLKELEATRSTENAAAQQHQANVNANANNVRNAADVAMASKNPYAMGIGGAVKAADKLTGGKSSEVLGKAMEKEFKRRPFGGLAQKASNKLSESGASDAIGKAASAKSGNVDGTASQKKSEGTVDGDAEIKIKPSAWKWILLASCGCIFVAFITALISSVYDLRITSVILGEMTAGDRTLLNDVIDAIDESGQGNELGMGEKYDKLYYDRLEVLGNNFSSELECEKEDCLDRPEVRYYIKVADIAWRYKYKYQVELDWVLLNATMMYSDRDEEMTMERSLHDYNLDDVENYDILMNLDWDYDYKKIPGYTYLSPADFRYDLQILAKNMVTKTTTQTCTKTVTREDGTTYTVVTKSRTDIDIEDQYLKPGETYYLKCDSGESYSIHSDYKYDADKYDEFLLEYIERKYYMPSDGSSSSSGNVNFDFCITNEFTKYDLTEEQLAQLASVAYHEQGTAKGAAAEASLMANLFEIKGSSYGTGADGLYNYVRNGGWFANAASHMDSLDASPEIIEAVRSVLVDGKRTLPGYIDEHDWINDLTSVTNDGTEITKTNRSLYKQHETVIKNKYGATYTFYSFPDTNSDPFGYTSEERREEIGEFHYDYDTGEAVNCSGNATDLSSAFVNVALSQQGVSGRPNTYTRWYGPISGYPDSGYSYPWCATFVSWVIANAEYGGIKMKDVINYKSASVYGFTEHFKNTDSLEYVDSPSRGGNYVPKEGDLIFFDWPGDDTTYDHIGIVVEAKDGYVYTIEGNTSNSVAARSYALDSNSILGYGVWY